MFHGLKLGDSGKIEGLGIRGLRKECTTLRDFQVWSLHFRGWGCAEEIKEGRTALICSVSGAVRELSLERLES